MYKLNHLPSGMNISRFLLAVCLILTVSVQVNAAPVSPEEAVERAMQFTASGNVGLFKSSRQPVTQADIVYVGKKGSTDCFYVINTNGGFVIVSADTRLNDVLGYSEEGNFDIDRISPDMQWWLDGYCDEIASVLPYLPETTLPAKVRRQASRNPIAPMLKTKWNQDAPFNNTCPMDSRYNKRSVTGCVATAMAQIMKYHEWPKQPKGSNGGVIFTGTTYDWSNMLDIYEQGKYNVTESTAVATLMRQCGAAVDMQYSYAGSGAYDNRAQYALFTYFDYSPDVRMVYRDYTMQKEWNNIVYTELAAGRPVYYSGSSSYGGHAFVCDGYSANEYFHFNWGWGGYQDGYFLLSALNPETGGAGSYEGGYNSHQMIFTGIRPAAGEAKKQTCILSTGTFYYNNNMFVSTESMYGDIEMFYNPLYSTESVYFGLKIISNDNPDATPTYVRCGSKVTLRPSYGTTEFAGTIPSLADGKYKIYGVFSEDGSNWNDILIPIGKQNYVTLTVAKGVKTLTNDGPDKSIVPHLIMGEPQTTSYIPASGEKIFRIPFINSGQGDFIGEIGLSLFGEGDFGNVISINRDVTVSGEGAVIVDFTTDHAVEPGEYQMYIIDASDEVISEDYFFTISADRMDAPDQSRMAVSNMSPQYYVAGDERVIMFSLLNNSKKTLNEKLGFVFVNMKTNKTVSTIWTSTHTIEKDFDDRVSFGPVKLPLDPGEYIWYVVDSDNKRISYPSTMIVESALKIKDGFTYRVTDASTKSAVLVANESGPYTGVLTVPAILDGYTVNRIAQGALAFSTVTDLTLPSGIDMLENGALYGNGYLQYLHLNGKDIITAFDETFAPEMAGRLWIDARDGTANKYARSEYWSEYLYPQWTLSAGAGTSFVGAVVTDPSGQLYNPFYVGFRQPMILNVTAPAGKNVRYTVKVGDKTDTGVIDPKNGYIQVPALDWNKGDISIEATTEEAGVCGVSDDDEIMADVYSTDGLLLRRSATREQLNELPAGLYIWNNTKIAVTR